MSSEMKDFREASKLHKKERQTINSHAITEWCTQHGQSIIFVTDWQIRIKTREVTIDVYPQSKKYHNITLNERGKIQGKITDFLNKIFNKQS